MSKYLVEEENGNRHIVYAVDHRHARNIVSYRTLGRGKIILVIKL